MFRVGMRLPVAFTATDQTFMNHLQDGGIRHRFRTGSLPAMTPHSPDPLEPILASVAHAQARPLRGRGVRQRRLIRFGAPVPGPADRTVAGVAVSLPAANRNAAADERVVFTPLRTVRTISGRPGAEIEDRAG